MKQLVAAIAFALTSAMAWAAHPTVEMKTSLGTIVIELYEDKAPKTVENFVQYVQEGFFNGTVFHRVVPGFVVQGGGFDKSDNQKPTRAPITNEAANGLKNARGIIALQGDASFGPAVAHGVNLQALRRGTDRLVHVASAPAQGMAMLTAALAGTSGSRTASAVEGRFVSLMRSQDVGAAVDLPATLALRPPTHPDCGAPDAVTAEALLHGAGARVPITAQAAELNQQLMHVLSFAVTLREDVSTADALARLSETERMALTDKMSPNPVFAFGRDHGYAGRLFNAAVVPRGALWVRGGREVMGAAWLPPEGSELFTAVALVLWFLEGEAALRRLDAFKPYIFKEL